MKTENERSIGSQATQKGIRILDIPSIGNRDTQAAEQSFLGKIDQYELVRELGGGGFGVVFLARDTTSGMEVAVKGLPPLVRNNAEELDQIRRNFALVAKLHHPNIASALVLHPARNVEYVSEQVRQALRVLSGDTLMVMMYAPGVTLSKWRKQFPDERVPIAQALEICKQIASAIDYAHSEKVVHRDIKPANIMIETRRSGEFAEDGQFRTSDKKKRDVSHLFVKVLDFGLAAEIRSSMNRVSQIKGDTSGTRPYMAPEQWAGKKQDGRTDQYALAVLFYELVSGTVPFASAFETGDPVIMMTAVETRTPDPLPELSYSQNAALARALSKKVDQRFVSCSSFVDVLTRGSASGLRGMASQYIPAWLAPAAEASLWLLKHLNTVRGVITDILSYVPPVSRLFDRVSGLFLAPRQTWEAIRFERLTIWDIYWNYLFVLAAIALWSPAKIAIFSKVDKEWKWLHLALHYVLLLVLILFISNLAYRVLKRFGAKGGNLLMFNVVGFSLVPIFFSSLAFDINVSMDKITWLWGIVWGSAVGYYLYLSYQGLTILMSFPPLKAVFCSIAVCSLMLFLYHKKNDAAALATEGVKSNCTNLVENIFGPPPIEEPGIEPLPIQPGETPAQKAIRIERERKLALLKKQEEKELKITNLLNQAQQQAKSGLWPELLTTADAVLVLDALNQKAKGYQTQAQKQIANTTTATINRLLNQAETQYNSKQWTALLQTAQDILQLDNQNSSAIEYANQANRELADIGKLDRIKTLLDQAEQHYKLKQWDALRKTAKDILTLDVQNKKAIEYEKHANHALAEIEKLEKVTTLLVQAEQYYKRKQWDALCKTANDILTLDVQNRKAQEYKQMAEEKLNEERELSLIASEKKASQISTYRSLADQNFDTQQWTNLLSNANEILKLDSTSELASTYKKTAEHYLFAPFVKIVATLDGRDVKAKVVLEKEEYDTPVTLRLKAGTPNDLWVYLDKNNQRFEASKTITPDWKGEKSVDVPLIATEPKLTPSNAPERGKNWVSPSTGMTFVWIESKQIWVGQYEVTNGEYRKMDPSHNSATEKDVYSLNGDRQPVVEVSYSEARQFAEWLTAKDAGNLHGCRYRLPSMEEFTDYIQCGDSYKTYPWGNNWPPRTEKAGNYDDETAIDSSAIENNYKDGHIVSCNVEASFENPWKLFGVGGNVWEACAKSATNQEFGGWRGASWKESTKKNITCLAKNGSELMANSDSGFRLVLSK